MFLPDAEIEILKLTEFLDPARAGRRELILKIDSPVTIGVGSLASREEVQRETNDKHGADLRLIIPDGGLAVVVLDRGESFNGRHPRLQGGEATIADWTDPRFMVMSSLGASIRRARGDATYATNVGFAFAWPGDRVLADPDPNGRFIQMPQPGKGKDDPKGTILEFGPDGSIGLTLTDPKQESRPIIIPGSTILTLQT